MQIYVLAFCINFMWHESFLGSAYIYSSDPLALFLPLVSLDQVCACMLSDVDIDK